MNQAQSKEQTTAPTKAPHTTKVQSLQYSRFSDATTGIEFHTVLDMRESKSLGDGVLIGIADVEDKDLKHFKDRPEAYKILSESDYQAILGQSHHHHEEHHHADDPAHGAPPDPSNLHKLSQEEEQEQGSDKPTRRRRNAETTIEQEAIGAAELQRQREQEQANENPLEGAPAPPAE